MSRPRLVEGEVEYAVPTYGPADTCDRCGRKPAAGVWWWSAVMYRPTDEDGTRPLGSACADCHSEPDLRSVEP